MSRDDGTSVDPVQEECELAIPGENKKLDTEEDGENLTPSVHSFTCPLP